MKKARNILLVITLLLSIVLITGCSSNDESSSDKIVELGETFTFDELEITLENNISFTKINNQFSDYNGKIVVRLPITVKNIKDETHSLNMFYYSMFGSKGTQVANVASYFDDSVDFAGELRSGASYTKYLYFLYDGNGKYAIEFDAVWGPKTIVEFDVNK